MNADALFNEGLHRARAGDYVAALALLRQTAALEGYRNDTYRLMGKVHFHLGELEGAQRCWRETLALEPGDAVSAACLATLRRFLFVRRVAGMFATLAFLMLLAGFLWHLWDSLRGVRLSLADLKAATARLAERIETTARTSPTPTPVLPAEKAPREPAQPHLAVPIETRYRIALAAALEGEIENARRLFESIARSMPENEPLSANVHFWLGRCLFELGDPRAALEQFRLVTDRYPNHAKAGDALLDAGRCYARLGERTQALLAWQRLLDGPFDSKLQAAARRSLERQSVRLKP